MDVIQPYVELLTSQINSSLSGLEAYQVVGVTLLSLVAVRVVSAVLAAVAKHGVKGALMMGVLSVAKAVPGGASLIDKESSKMLHKLEKEILERSSEGKSYLELPAQGVPEKELFGQLQKWKTSEEKIWKTGKVSGAVYHGGEDLKELINRAYEMFGFANPLHADVFPYVRRMEAEVVRMSVRLFNGGSEECGCMTSGGTESILMACKAYRDEAHSRGIEHPEMVIPSSAHAAFHKADHYFGIKMVLVPVDPNTFKADVRAMERAITRNTVALVGSAPSYPQGVLDPIEELSEVAQRHGLGLHVDSCLGGFLLPFLPECGYHVDPFDFRVPGVTTISADPHKFGFAPKGCSVVLYRSKKLRRFQYFAYTDWSGGMYASPSIAGSRPGGLIAGCYAGMLSIGRAGYVRHAKAIMGAATAIREGIAQIDGVKVMGDPVMSVVAFDTTDGTDIYKVAEAMSNRGWNLNSLQFPRSVHICCTYMHVNTWQDLLADLQASYIEARDFPNRFKDGSAAMYGMAESLPDRSIVAKLVSNFVDAMYVAE